MNEFTKELNYKGVVFDITYTEQPEETQTLDYPGCPFSIDISEINHKDTEFYDFFTGDQLHEILCEIYYQLENEY
jgi:hypothetical protein